MYFFLEWFAQSLLYCDVQYNIFCFYEKLKIIVCNEVLQLLNAEPYSFRDELIGQLFIVRQDKGT